MSKRWIDGFTHTIWHSQRNAAGWFDVAYPIFNIVEALCWLGVALYVFRRAVRSGLTRLEVGYSALWFAFGLTDLREAYAQQTGLIVLKGAILVALVLIRRRVLSRYPGARAV